MERKKSVKAIAGLAGLSLIVAACGNGGEATTANSSDETTPPSTSTAEDTSTSVAETDEGDGTLTLDFEGLEPLGDEFNYEAWTIVDDQPVTAGIFDIAEDGSLINDDGEPTQLSGAEGATAVVISIEPAVDSDPAPAKTKVLGGPIENDGSVSLSIDHPAALGTDFSDVAGSYILATPTTETKDDETSGVWFLNLPEGAMGEGPTASLDLPTLPEGWLYEGWVVVDGTPISTGTFSAAEGSDNSGTFSGPGDGPAYPGEDFVTNAPEGFDFPLDLSGSKVVISVEPDPDNGDAPFALKPLAGDIPSDASADTSYELAANPSQVTGSGEHTA